MANNSGWEDVGTSGDWEDVNGSKPAGPVTPQWKNEALSALAKTYKGGDWLKFQADAVNPKMAFKPSSSSARDNEIRDLVNAVRAINVAQTFEDYRAAQPDNKYTDYLSNIMERKSWNKASNKDSMAGQVQQTLFPNVTYRSQEGAGLPSKAIGGLWDVLTIPSRAITAGVAGFGPEGEALSFTDRMGRPNELATGGEAAVDVVAPSGVGGMAGKAIGKTGRVVEEFARSKGYVLPQKLERLAFGPVKEKAADVVFDTKRGNLPAKERFWEGAETGAREGLAYSAIPTAMEATSPESGSGADAAGTAGGMVALSALTGGLGNLALNPAMRQFENELTGGYATINRLKNAAEREPRSSSIEGVGQLNAINTNLENTLGKLGSERDRLVELADAAKMKAEQSGKTGAYGSNRRADVAGGDINLSGASFANPENAPSILGRSVDEADIFPAQKVLAGELLNSLAKKYSADISNQTMAELVKMRSVAGKLAKETVDPDKKVAAQVVFDDIKQAMDDLARKTTISKVTIGEMKPLTPESPMANMRVVPAGMSLKDFSAAVKSGEMAPAVPMRFATVSVSRTPLKEKLDPLYADMSEIYRIQGDFLDPEKFEKQMRGVANARLDPLSRSGEFQDAAKNLDQIVGLLNKHKVPGAAGAEWTRSDVDYITPAVVREVRKRLKGEEGTAFGTMLSRLSQTRSLLGVPAALGKSAVGAAKLTARGVPVAPAYSADRSGSDVGYQGGMIPMNILGNK